MKSVAIIGAGITGLTAAFYLKRKGVPVTVYEASGRVGGVIQSLRQDGYLAEFGPNTRVSGASGGPSILSRARSRARSVPTTRARRNWAVSPVRPAITTTTGPLSASAPAGRTWKLVAPGCRRRRRIRCCR